jgi:hypothetical protein
MSKDFELKHPSLIDRKWKRVLWLASCLVFIPVVIMIIKIPFFVIDEVKKFIKGRKD